jgi:putative addiction module component (TIGR02574 family)
MAARVRRGTKGNVSFAMSTEISHLHGLPVAEKLRIIGELWDSITASGESIILPPAVIDEAQRRSDELLADPSIAIDDDELWRRVDG